MNLHVILTGALLALTALAWPHEARSQNYSGVPYRSGPYLGLRGGYAKSPDHFHFGLSVWNDISPRVRFQPNMEFGQYKGGILLSFNPEAVWLGLAPFNQIRPYIGGGPSINLSRRESVIPGDNPSPVARFGFSILYGLEIPLKRYNAVKTEFALGFGYSPLLKTTIEFSL